MDPQSLLLFFSLRQPRRIRVIENVLSGRKTVSNLYWGMRYGLLDYLNALKSVNKTQDRKSLDVLIRQGELITSDQRNYQLTPDGYQKQLNLKRTWYVPKFLKYNQLYDLNRFKSRFLLAIQAASEYSYHNRNYYPLQINYGDAEIVKRWFYDLKDHELTARCFRFLRKFFDKLDRLDSTLGWQAANLLVGHNDSGLTLLQEERKIRQPITELLFRQLDILGALTVMIINHPNPFGNLLLGTKISPISFNALRTYRMACNRYRFNQIGQIQHIKPSTVKEHLLSAAIFYPSKFPFQNFISKSLIKSFQQIYQGDPDEWDFSKFQSVTGTPLDFFYFRLYQILRSYQND